MPDNTLRLAILIDADNASPAVIGEILGEVATFGTASVKRVYGDFTSANLNGWRSVLAEHAIQPIQQFRNTIGENASDSALIIDAMDLLHTRQLGGFCLVSSDSDFTRLATRIREDGISVFGFGEQKTPKAFIQACDRFIYTEIFRKRDAVSAKVEKTNKVKPLRELDSDNELKTALNQAVDNAMTEIGRANLGTVGSYLTKLPPDFDSRNYGFQKLSELVEQIPTLSLTRENPNSSSQVIYVSRK
jgi:hypothetical protein